jgi:DNA polymerase III delta subunit
MGDGGAFSASNQMKVCCLIVKNDTASNHRGLRQCRSFEQEELFKNLAAIQNRLVTLNITK